MGITEACSHLGTLGSLEYHGHGCPLYLIRSGPPTLWLSCLAVSSFLVVVSVSHFENLLIDIARISLLR